MRQGNVTTLNVHVAKTASEYRKENSQDFESK